MHFIIGEMRDIYYTLIIYHARAYIHARARSHVHTHTRERACVRACVYMPTVTFTTACYWPCKVWLLAFPTRRKR